MSHTGRYASVDIPANDNPATVLLVLRNGGDDDYYAHSFGKLGRQSDDRYEPYKVARGSHRVVFRFACDNIEEQATHSFVQGDENVPRLLNVATSLMKSTAQVRLDPQTSARRRVVSAHSKEYKAFVEQAALNPNKRGPKPKTAKRR